MIPRDSDIGYLHYEDVILPITSVRMDEGNIVFFSVVFTDLFESISVDQRAACTIVGADGTQIMWVPRAGEPDIATARHGGRLTVSQQVKISSSERNAL